MTLAEKDIYESITGARPADRPIHAHRSDSTLCGRVRSRVLSFEVSHSLGMRYVTCEKCLRKFYLEGK